MFVVREFQKITYVGQSERMDGRLVSERYKGGLIEKVVRSCGLIVQNRYNFSYVEFAEQTDGETAPHNVSILSIWCVKIYYEFRATELSLCHRSMPQPTKWVLGAKRYDLFKIQGKSSGRHSKERRKARTMSITDTLPLFRVEIPTILKVTLTFQILAKIF